MSFLNSTTHDFRRITKLLTTGKTYHCTLYQAHEELQRKWLALAPQCLLVTIWHPATIAQIVFTYCQRQSLTFLSIKLNPKLNNHIKPSFSDEIFDMYSLHARNLLRHHALSLPPQWPCQRYVQEEGMIGIHLCHSTASRKTDYS